MHHAPHQSITDSQRFNKPLEDASVLQLNDLAGLRVRVGLEFGSESHVFRGVFHPRRGAQREDLSVADSFQVGRQAADGGEPVVVIQHGAGQIGDHDAAGSGIEHSAQQ